MSSHNSAKPTPVRPVPGERNVLITSALPYVNNVPHLGNIIGSTLSADVYARYCRQRGYNTLYVCGTDEYGTATETKALEDKVTPQEICDKYNAIHGAIYDWFDISFDHFGRTSTPEQTEIVQSIFQDLLDRGFVHQEELEQLYDPVVDKFLADRFVFGTCPACAYEDARGDQCDRCGKLLNPMELLNPKSALSSTTPVKRTSTHLFLDLPSLQPRLEKWLDQTTKSGDWSGVALHITNGWIQDGLKSRCITRDLKWGVPVPLEGFENKVFYVWFDAPIGYISITANYAPDHWREWWQNPDNVELVQFMGKDNVPFHSVVFPCSLLGTERKWTMVNSLSSTEYLNYEDGKFSKSRNTGVFGDQARETGIPSEVWRYYLLTNRPEHGDTVFSWEDFQSKNNNELLANLGNFINRLLKFVANNYGGTVPALASDLANHMTEAEQKRVDEINAIIKDKYVANMERLRLKDGLHACMDVSRVGNVYLQEMKYWELFKKDEQRCAVVVSFALQIVRCLAALVEPFMPGLTRRILDQLNLQTAPGTINRIYDEIKLDSVPGGHQIGSPEPLFAKYDNAFISGLRAKFGGNVADKEKFLLDLRVSKIIEVQDHPSADMLFKMKVQVGSEGDVRQIIGGLKGRYGKEELIGKTVIAVANLKHAKMRGEKSEGMLLVAKGADGTIGLLQPADDVSPGTPVVPKGAQLDLPKVVQPKVLKAELGKLALGTDRVAMFLDKFPLLAADVSIVSDDESIAEGSSIF